MGLALFDANRHFVGKDPFHLSAGHPGIFFDLSADHIKVKIENIAALFDIRQSQYLFLQQTLVILDPHRCHRKIAGDQQQPSNQHRAEQKKGHTATEDRDPE